MNTPPDIDKYVRMSGHQSALAKRAVRLYSIRCIFLDLYFVCIPETRPKEVEARSCCCEHRPKLSQRKLQSVSVRISCTFVVRGKEKSWFLSRFRKEREVKQEKRDRCVLDHWCLTLHYRVEEKVPMCDSWTDVLVLCIDMR